MKKKKQKTRILNDHGYIKSFDLMKSNEDCVAITDDILLILKAIAKSLGAWHDELMQMDGFEL
ncbi:hypothetical protein [Legionella sp. W05-934-2]|uniref:hypothetical protein n=1 Tax=Legionella sp. W05-934-2 TaxID=1198649 RepID=UPI0034618681